LKKQPTLLQRSHRPLARFWGPTFKGKRDGKGAKGKEGESRRGEVGEGEGEGRDGRPQIVSWLQAWGEGWEGKRVKVRGRGRRPTL